MRKYLFLILFMSLQMVARGQTIAVLDSLGLPHPTTAKSMRYWLDSDDSSVNTVSDMNGRYTIDAASLIDGLHTVHYQIVDNENKVGPAYSSIFLKIAEATTANLAATLRYWFDDDTNIMTCDANVGVQQLDASGLLDGLHTLHYQVVDADGKASYIASNIFLKMKGTDPSEKVTASKLIYWFDDQQETTTVEATDVVQVLDASSLLDGLHTIHYLVVCSDGSKTSAYSSIFLRMNVDTEATIAKRMRYWFDDETSMTEVEVATGTQTLDASHLLEGLHTLHYQLVDSKGNVCAPVSGIFLKQFDKVVESGENVITKYMYWMNDNSLDSKKVDIPQPSSPYELITLLPMEQAPIRSSKFHFEVTDGVPTVYANNDIHFRFYDAAGYWSDASRSFVDYREKHEITDIAELQSSQTFSRPGNNEVKWFKFEAEYGDSIALKSSQASSIQIFNSAGKELFAGSGSESISYGGCHLFEDGTFYVAVHDVTGSASNVTIESLMIDKFCIFEYSPDRISDTGKTLVSIKGNGLNFVKKVELYNEDFCVVSDTIVQNINELLARIGLKGLSTTNTKYSLRVFFNNEERNDSMVIELEDAITVEPVQKGDIVVEVKRENRVGDPYPVQVIVRNTGNTSCYAIPMNIAFDNVENFDDVYFMNFQMLISESLYESRDFFTYTDNLVGTGKKGLFIPMLIPYLGPYDEIIYTLGIKTKIAHAEINLYAWTGDPWYDSSVVIAESNSRNITRATSSNPCNSPSIPPASDMFPDLNNGGDGNTYDADHIYGPGDAMDEVTDFPLGPGQVLKPFLGAAEAIGGIQQGVSRRNEDMLAKMGAVPMGDDIDDYRFKYRYNPRSPRDIFNDANPFNARGITRASGSRRSIQDYASGDCNPPKPYPVNPWIPGDPNEITGYLSESGSHYINAEVVNVGYDIEFENDPEIANAAAHHIVIHDTLDARLFDFDSFMPRTVKISGKEVELDGTYPFVKTVDMRPEIYSIAELRGDFDKKTGIATWDLIALDPMTMEPTDDIMQGILPVNTQDGNGIGNVTYTINLKPNLQDGTEIHNHAGIIFDYNDVILTPVWTNIIDAVSPVSQITTIVQQNDTIAKIYFEGDDERSGIWKYDLYVQYGNGTSWEKIAVCAADSSYIDFRYYEGLDYGFCVLATDSAGNVEKKDMIREKTLAMVELGDVNCDGEVNTKDSELIMAYYLEQQAYILALAADMNGDGEINTLDATLVNHKYKNGDNANLNAKDVAKESSSLRVWVDSKISLTADSSTVAYLKLYETDGYHKYTSFNLNFNLPEGIHVHRIDADDETSNNIVLSERATTSHSIACNMPNDTILKIASVSSENLDFSNEGKDGNAMNELFTIGFIADPTMVNGDYIVTIPADGLVFNMKYEDTYASQSVKEDITCVFTITGGVISSIRDVSAEVNSGDFYDLHGHKLNAPLKSGIYIHNGKKVAK